MNLIKVYASLAIILVVCTYATEGTGLTLLLLLKLMALKGSLFYGMPLAIGSFMLGQGMGFFGGTMYGGYSMMDASHKYHKSHVTKVVATGDGFGTGIGAFQPFPSGPLLNDHGPTFSSGGWEASNAGDVTGETAGWSSPAPVSDFHAVENVVTNPKEEGSHYHEKFPENFVPPNFIPHGPGHYGPRPSILRNFFSIPARIVHHYRGHRRRPPPVFGGGHRGHRGGHQIISSHYESPPKNSHPVWTGDWVPVKSTDSSSSPAVAHAHDDYSFSDGGQNEAVSIGKYESAYDSSIPSANHGATHTPIYDSVSPAGAYESSSISPATKFYAPPLSPPNYDNANQLPAPVSSGVAENSSPAPAAPLQLQPPAATPVAAHAPQYSYAYNAQDPALLVKTASAGVENQQLHQLLQTLDGGNNPSNLYHRASQENGQFLPEAAAASDRKEKSVPAPNSAIEKFLEDRLKNEIKSNDTTPGQKKEAEQLLATLRQVYVQELVDKINSQNSNGVHGNRGLTTELPEFKPFPMSDKNSTKSNFAIAMTTANPMTPPWTPVVQKQKENGGKLKSSAYASRPFKWQLEKGNFVARSKPKLIGLKNPRIPHQFSRRHLMVEKQNQNFETSSPAKNGPNFNKKEVEKFFLLISMLDQNKCLQKLVCHVHTRKGSKDKLTVYEQNIVNTFEILNTGAMDHQKTDSKASSEFKKAAKLGETSKSAQSCAKAFPLCVYSPGQVIKLGNLVAATGNLDSVKSILGHRS